MIYTTLNEIRAFNPSKSAWSRLLSHLGKTAADDEPLPLVTVLDSHGLEGTIWCLRVCPDIAAEFARWCADRVDGADDPAEAAEAACCATLAANCATLAAEASCWAACCATLAANCATSAAEASCWASCWAADGASWATERQAQADKLRELLS